VPSAGALYPLELYVAAATVRGLVPGLYHFQPFRHSLSFLAPLEWSLLRSALVDPSPLDTSAVLVVVIAVFWRSRIKYGLRGYRFALLEAGHLVQTIQLAATHLGLHALPVGGFFDRRLDQFLGIDGLDEAAVYAVALGGAL
jgi:SagB-type dehydrogenase family enzyme